MQNRKTKGFTFLELLIIMGIISILAGIILVALQTAREKSKIGRAISETRSFSNLIELLATDTNMLPTGDSTKQSANDCIATAGNNEVYLDADAAGLKNTDGNFGAKWSGPYVADVQRDPWGNKYWFDSDYDCSTAPPAENCQGYSGMVQAIISSGKMEVI